VPLYLIGVVEQGALEHNVVVVERHYPSVILGFGHKGIAAPAGALQLGVLPVAHGGAGLGSRLG
jgi:hypothetical protein